MATSRFSNYVTFHSHPKSLDTGSTPKAFVEREVELGTGAVTVTDHGSLGACMEVYQLARKAGITPILGLEGYFRDEDCPLLRAAGVEKISDYWNYGHVTMHATDQASYEVMVQVLSRAALGRAEKHGSELKPLFGWADLEEICGAGKVTIGSGCLIGMVGRHLMKHDNPDMARKYYERLRAVAGPGNFHVEVMPHVCDRKHVSGIFITLEGEEVPVRYWNDKKLRTNEGELAAQQLAAEFARKSNKHETLLAVKNRQKWEDREPKKILKVEKIDGEFMLNECRSWTAGTPDLQLGVNEFVLRLAAEYGDPVVVSDDSHFARPDEKVVQDARAAASGGGMAHYQSYHRMSSEESFEILRGQLGVSERDFAAWVDNSRAWADRFRGMELKYSPSLPTKFYPEDTLRHCMQLIEQHGRMRWGDPRYVDRLRRELAMLHQNGTVDLLPYFFLAAESVDQYHQRDIITGPGRGSAAGLWLAYLLEITQVDPLEHDLSLERFLSEDRIKSGSLPDIDMDFPHRDLLVDEENPENGWLHRRFGDHHVQISTDTTLKARNACKDALRYGYGEVPKAAERLTHQFEEAPQGVSERNFVLGYDTPEGRVQGAAERCPHMIEFQEKWPREWDLAVMMMGVARQPGRHPCGRVIANRPIHEFIPVTKVGGVTVTQYTAESVEAAGGVKMDYLTVNALRDISTAMNLVQARSGIEIPETVEIDDERVRRMYVLPHNGKLLNINKIYRSPWVQDAFNDVAAGDTVTVFQFSTPGARKFLRLFDHEVRPGVKAIDSLAAMATFTALDRPGPLDMYVATPDGARVNMLEEYSRRARGLAPSTDLPDFFMDLIPETLGVLCFQESVQKLYQHLTGCSGVDAENFRRDVAKKKKEKIQKAYPYFMEKAAAKIGQTDAQKCWETIEKFSEYGFSKNHAVPYALIGLQCAYLKRHFPLEWWTAVLCNAKKEDINEKYWPHVGHLIDLPDAKHSGENFEIQGTRIRAPLSLLRGIGEKAHDELVAGRPYADIGDLCRRIQANKEAGASTTAAGKKKLGHSSLHRGVIYTLIVAGAADGLFPPGMPIIEQMEEYERCLAEASGAKREKVKDGFASVDWMTRYQMRKRVLSAYSEPTLPMVAASTPGCLVPRGPGRWSYAVPHSRGAFNHDVVTGRHVAGIDALPIWPDRDFDLAVTGYVEAVRRWKWATGSGCEITLDSDGCKIKTIKWGPRSGELDAMYDQDLVGSIVIAALRKGRNQEKKPWSVSNLTVVRRPLSKEE